MEPPRKRLRTTLSSGFDILDTDQEFLKARSQNDFRLKSTFESIFDKYSKDFSTVGDEIDLETGEIVVNNGHLRKMRDEQDAGKLLSMLMAAPGDYDDLGDYEAEEIERKAIIAIPELEDFFTESRNKADIGGDLGKSENHMSSSLGSGLEGTPHIGTNIEERSCSTTQSGLPSSADILRQFGMNIGPRIIQYVAQLQTGDNRRVDPVWHTPALPQAPCSKEPPTEPIPELLTKDRAVSPTRHSLWASKSHDLQKKQTKAQATGERKARCVESPVATNTEALLANDDESLAQAQPKKSHPQIVAEPKRCLPKSSEVAQSEDQQLAPLEQPRKTIQVYSPNTRRKVKGDSDPVRSRVETKTDHTAQAPIVREETAHDERPKHQVLHRKATVDREPVSNMKLRRSARLSSAPDVVLNIQFSKSPMKIASRMNLQGGHCQENGVGSTERVSDVSTALPDLTAVSTSKDLAPSKSDRPCRLASKQGTASAVASTPSRKNTLAKARGQSTPVSSLLKPRNRNKEHSSSPSNGRSRGRPKTRNILHSDNPTDGSDDKDEREARSVHSSPRTSATQTSNGTLGRCGEKGFRCSKDFCMKCL